VKCKANHVTDEAVEVIQRVLGNVKRYIEGYEQERFGNLNDVEVKRSLIVV